MNDDVIPAIVFRVEKFMPMPEIHKLLDNIRTRCTGWTGTGEYKAVVSFLTNPPHDDRLMSDFGPLVPYDPDAMDQILLEIPELTSVRRFHELDLTGGRKKKKSGAKPPEPKPDPALFPYGWDITKVAPGLQHLHEPEAREQAEKFIELLTGYPFSDKTVEENQTYIETEVIAVLDDQLPHMKDVDIYHRGAVVRTLRAIANPENQSKDLGDFSLLFRRMFLNHPSTIIGICQEVLRLLTVGKQDVLANVQKPQGIAARYSELILDQEMDYITETSTGANDAVHADDLSDAAKARIKKQQSVNLS